jgi:hypothetical protein
MSENFNSAPAPCSAAALNEAKRRSTWRDSIGQRYQLLSTGIRRLHDSGVHVPRVRMSKKQRRAQRRADAEAATNQP